MNVFKLLGATVAMIVYMATAAMAGCHDQTSTLFDTWSIQPTEQVVQVAGNVPCVDVPDAAFQPGTNNRPADYDALFCIPRDIWAAIDEEGEWVLRLITFNADGSVRWHQAHKVVGSQCHTQGVYAGTIARVYVTCTVYWGWLGTGPVRSNNPSFSEIDWSLDWRAL